MLEFFRPAVLTMLLSQLVYKMLCTTYGPPRELLLLHCSFQVIKRWLLNPYMPPLALSAFP